MEQETVLKSVEKTVRDIFASFNCLPVHDISHVERVVDTSQKICVGEKLDSFLSKLNGWLHDIGRLDEFKARLEGQKVFHSAESAKHVREILLPLGLAENQIEIVRYAIEKHSDLIFEPDPIWLVILHDADMLDAMGGIGFPRSFPFYDGEGAPIYFPNDPFKVTLADMQGRPNLNEGSQIGAFLGRNFYWALYLRTETAKRIAVSRIKLMLDFLYQFADEVGWPRSFVDKNEIVLKVRKSYPNLANF